MPLNYCSHTTFNFPPLPSYYLPLPNPFPHYHPAALTLEEDGICSASTSTQRLTARAYCALPSCQRFLPHTFFCTTVNKILIRFFGSYGSPLVNVPHPHNTENLVRVDFVGSGGHLDSGVLICY